MDIKYFDHSATTPIDKSVLQEMVPYLKDSFGNPSSSYDLGKKNKEAINLARMKIATLINSKVNEIYFTSGGSESDNMIIKGIAIANRRRGNHIITSTIEHPAVLNSMKYLEKCGFKVTYLRPRENGIINIEDFKKHLTKSTILVSIMFVNNEIGTIQPIKEIGSICRKYGIFFHTDAVQAMGYVNVDVKEYNIDALSMSSHKFYGPKGIGVSYIKENVSFVNLIDGGHQERDRRAGTENVAGIVGTAKALENAYKNMNENNKKIKALRDYYIVEIKRRIPYIKINGDLKDRVVTNANISFAGIVGDELLKELNKDGICVSSGSACSAGFVNPSHVLLSLGLSKNLSKAAVRVTFGKDNTREETEFLVDKVEEGVNKLRKKAK